MKIVVKPNLHITYTSTTEFSGVACQISWSGDTRPKAFFLFRGDSLSSNGHVSQSLTHSLTHSLCQ